jgi:hypothetical protein
MDGWMDGRMEGGNIGRKQGRQAGRKEKWIGRKEGIKKARRTNGRKALEYRNAGILRRKEGL